MRRKDREITDINEILNIIDSCRVLRLGLCDNNIPYIVPLNYYYTYKNNIIEFYFHSAKEGKKLDIIRKNQNVCLEIDCGHELKGEGPNAVNYSYKFNSVIGFGKADFVYDKEEKRNILFEFAKFQTGKSLNLSDEHVEMTNICKITINKISGKKLI